MAAHVLTDGMRRPDKIALSVVSADASENLSFGEVIQTVRGIATGLLARGLTQGDIVMLRLGNTPEFPLAYLGAIAAGLLPVPTSAQLTEPETAAILEELRPALILHDANVACPDHPARLDSAALSDMRALPPADFAMGDPNRPAYIVYTSGSSGKPRAVMHAHRAIWARQMMVNDWYGLRAEDRLLHAGAFNWTYTLGTGIMDPWTAGATALIPKPGTQPEEIPALLRTHQASLFAAAPGVYRKLLKTDRPLPLPDLRHGLSAGEKLSPKLRAAWEQLTGRPVFEAFGMSECSTFISGAPGRVTTEDALGRPQVGRRIAILGPDGPVPRGEPGVIAIDRDDPGLMLGYVGAEAETEARFQGRWFVTGDHGIMTEDDQIHYLGRSDDMMNAGGYRVSPIEVEEALSSFPGLTGIAATDIEVKDDTRVITVFYTSDVPLAEEDLSAFAAARLARYKQPRAYIRVKALPLGPNGKLRRRALKPLAKDRSHG